VNAARWVAVLDVDKVDRGPLVHYRYTLTTSSAQADLPLALRVDVPVRPQAMELICRALQVGAERAPDHARRLRRNGEMLYRLLFPGHSQQARLLSARLADWQDPLVISTNDVQVPWELVHDGTDFLGTRLAVGRQIVTSELFQEGRPIRPIGETRRALIVSNPTDDLDSADDESTVLEGFLTSRGIECTVLGRDKAYFVDVLQSLTYGAYDIFHYSGHVGKDESGNAGLRLKDQYLGVEEIRAVCSALDDGPTAAPPVVFLNGCRSAEHLSSVCGAFLDTGSRIVVGTRYRIVDSAAREFAECWYAGLLAGMSAGQALQEARNSQRRGLTGTWASFVLFGQPATRLWEPPAESPEPEPEPGQEGAPAAGPRKEADRPKLALLSDKPWDEHARNLDDEAQRLLLEIVDSARGFGVVTSFHLAAGLVTVPSALTSAVEAAEIDPRWLSEIVALHPNLARTGSHGSPTPSENVRRVLDRAVQLARTDGRDTATIDDLTSAFTATGGGEAGKLLSLLGVDLGSSGSLFTDSGGFRGHYLAPETQRAVYCARLLAASNGEIISSYSLLLGFALSSSATLREALLDQGTAGESAVRALFPEASHPRLSEFSRRATLSFERALEAGRNAGGGPIDDALVLREVLADPTSTACRLLTKLGVDPARVRASLVNSATRGQTADGEGSS
jgi:hypothetical protein